MSKIDDPYHDVKIYHKGARWGQDGSGAVSPLCAEPNPRKLNLKKELWTLRWDAVTCKKCLAKRGEE